MRTPTSFPLPVDRPTDVDLLNLWLAARASADMDVIRDSETYRHIWSTWCTYLKSGRNFAQSESIAWYQVKPETVVGFLGTGPTDRKNKSASTNNETTRRRYWRVLDRIYNFAAMNGWIDSNPVQGLTKDDVPKAENSLGTILDPLVWQASQKLLAEPEKFDPISVRNRAMMSLVFTLALAPQELRALKTTSLLYGGQEGEGSQLIKVHVDGHGTLRPRTLPLTPSTSSAIEEWLKLRPVVAAQDPESVLFCTSKGPISSVNLYLLVQSFLKKASSMAGREPPSQKGPQVIRNSVLVRMLEQGEYTSAWVAKFAGLKNVKGLWHLREQCSAEVRATLTNVRDDADTAEALF